MKTIILAAGASALALIGTAGAFAQQAAAPHGHVPMADMTRTALVQKLDARFAAIDTNHDGTISKEERMAARQAHRDARFAKLDTDKNGQLSRAEFDAQRMGGHGHRGHRGGEFGRMGGDKDGAVTKADFEGRALARFDRMDANHDGTVTVAERQAAWAAMKARHGADRS